MCREKIMNFPYYWCMKTVDVLHGNITRSLLSLYFPILICSVIQQLSSMINLMLVGNYMSSFVLGIIGGSASMMVTLFTNPMVALISGSMVCVATAYGEKNTKKTNNAIFTSFVIIAFFTFVYIAIYEFFGTTVLNAFHVPSSQIADASLYIHLYSIGLIFFAFFQLTINILRSIGNVEFPNYILIFSCILNILLDYVFICFLRLNIIGICISYILTQGISFVISFGYLFRSFAIKGSSFEKSCARILFSVGIPAMIVSFIFAFTNMFVQGSINKLGEEVVSAYAVFIRIENFYWIAMTGVDFAVCTFISQNFGAQNIQRIKKSMKTSITLSFGITAICATAFYLFSKTLVRLFVSEPDIIEISCNIMKFMAPLYFTYTLIEVLLAFFKGINKAIIPTVFNIIFVICIRLGWLVLVADKNPSWQMIQLCYPLSWSATSICYLLYYRMAKGKIDQNT